MQNKPRLDDVSGRLQRREGGRTVRGRADRSLARGILLSVDGDREADGTATSSSLRRAKDFSPELLARLEANGREYAAKYGNPFDWFGKPRDLSGGSVAGAAEDVSEHGTHWSALK
jgi:hypothetical protein